MQGGVVYSISWTAPAHCRRPSSTGAGSPEPALVSLEEELLAKRVVTAVSIDND